VLGVDAEVNPVVDKKLKRGIYVSDRIHSLVMGFPGSGKTRFLLFMIKQHIDNNEGFLVLVSDSDLTGCFYLCCDVFEGGLEVVHLK